MTNQFLITISSSAQVQPIRQVVLAQQIYGIIFAILNPICPGVFLSNHALGGAHIKIEYIWANKQFEYIMANMLIFLKNPIKRC